MGRFREVLSPKRPNKSRRVEGIPVPEPAQAEHLDLVAGSPSGRYFRPTRLVCVARQVVARDDLPDQERSVEQALLDGFVGVREQS